MSSENTESSDKPEEKTSDTTEEQPADRLREEISRLKFEACLFGIGSRRLKRIYEIRKIKQRMSSQLTASVIVTSVSNYLTNAEAIIDRIYPDYTPMNAYLKTARFIVTVFLILRILIVGKNQFHLQQEHLFGEDEGIEIGNGSRRWADFFLKAINVWCFLLASLLCSSLGIQKFMEHTLDGTRQVPRNSTRERELIAQLFM
uniref:Conserved plasma membrane protein n=1 Tax=Caenorhabditis tropicalis TaxID=1561998 RepID=A0A1I7TWR1_9PELO